MQGFNDPLAALRDIHLPSGPPWWPFAPGWWLVSIVVLLSSGWFIFYIVKRWRQRTALRRAALAGIRRLRQRAARGEPHQLLLAELSLLLRSVAIKAFPNESVAGLIEQSWLEFLDRAGTCTDFNHGPGRSLLSAPYQSGQRVDIQNLFDIIERWIAKTT